MVEVHYYYWFYINESALVSQKAFLSRPVSVHANIPSMSVMDGLAWLWQIFVQKCRCAQGLGAKVAPNSCFSFQLLHVATSQGGEDEQRWVMTRRDLKLAISHCVSPALIFATFWLRSVLNWGFRSVLESDISESYKHVTNLLLWQEEQVGKGSDCGTGGMCSSWKAQCSAAQVTAACKCGEDAHPGWADRLVWKGTRVC